MLFQFGAVIAQIAPTNVIFYAIQVNYHIHMLYSFTFHMLYGELVILRLPAVEIEAAIGIPHLIGRRHLHSFQKVRKRPDDGHLKIPATCL